MTGGQRPVNRLGSPPIIADDIQQSYQVLNDACAADVDKLLAGLNIALAVVFELLEPDELLPVGLPVDDIGRKVVVRAAREGVTEAGVEGFEKAVRKTAGDDIADRAFREMGLDDLVGAACSFSPETPVTTELGLRPIGSLWRGLEVWAYNEATGEFGWYPITAVWAHQDETIIYLIINGELILTTPDHPFFTDTLEQIPAGHLQVGDRIWQGDLGYGVVEAVVFVSQPQLMYNLTVDEAHTYFVGAGQWLVHNVCGGVTRLTAGEIRKLQKAGFDIHELKGGKKASRFDLYKDDNGDVYKALKGGKGEFEFTGFNINDFHF